MLFLVLILVKNVFLGLKKGINDLLHQVVPKHTAQYLPKNNESIKTNCKGPQLIK